MGTLRTLVFLGELCWHGDRPDGHDDLDCMSFIKCLKGSDMATKSTTALVGVFVLMGVFALAFLALKAANIISLSAAKTYTVRARFDDIGGLKKNAGA